MSGKPLLKELLLVSIVLWVLNRVALYYHLYIWNVGGEFDSLVHFMAGVTVGLGALWFYFYSGLFSPQNKKYLDFWGILALSIVLIGVSWEVYELVTGITMVSQPDYFYDTSLDLTFDLFGSVVACIYAFSREKKFKTIEINV